MLLATLCLFVPDIEERLREAMPGRGRQKTAEVIEGASNCFFLDPSLPDASKKVCMAAGYRGGNRCFWTPPCPTHPKRCGGIEDRCGKWNGGTALRSDR